MDDNASVILAKRFVHNTKTLVLTNNDRNKVSTEIMMNGINCLNVDVVILEAMKDYDPNKNRVALVSQVIWHVCRLSALNQMIVTDVLNLVHPARMLGMKIIYLEGGMNISAIGSTVTSAGCDVICKTVFDVTQMSLINVPVMYRSEPSDVSNASLATPATPLMIKLMLNYIRKCGELEIDTVTVVTPFAQHLASEIGKYEHKLSVNRVIIHANDVNDVSDPVLGGSRGVHSRSEKAVLVNSGEPFYVDGFSPEDFTFRPEKNQSIHAVTGVFNGEKFDNRKRPEFIKIVYTKEGDEAALLDNSSDVLRDFIASAKDGERTGMDRTNTLDIVIRSEMSASDVIRSGSIFIDPSSKFSALASSLKHNYKSFSLARRYVPERKHPTDVTYDDMFDQRRFSTILTARQAMSFFCISSHANTNRPWDVYSPLGGGLWQVSDEWSDYVVEVSSSLFPEFEIDSTSWNYLSVAMTTALYAGSLLNPTRLRYIRSDLIANIGGIARSNPKYDGLIMPSTIKNMGPMPNSRYLCIQVSGTLRGLLYSSRWLFIDFNAFLKQITVQARMSSRKISSKDWQAYYHNYRIVNAGKYPVNTLFHNTVEWALGCELAKIEGALFGLDISKTADTVKEMIIKETFKEPSLGYASKANAHCSSVLAANRDLK